MNKKIMILAFLVIAIIICETVFAVSLTHKSLVTECQLWAKGDKMSSKKDNNRIAIANGQSEKEVCDSTSWDDYFKDYLKYLRALSLADRTVKESIYPLNQFKRFCEDRSIYHPRFVSEKDILDFAEYQLKTIKSSTLIYKILTLKQFFAYLAREGVINYDVSVTIKLPRASKTLPKTIPTPLEFVQLVQSIDTSTLYGFMYRTIIELFYGTGMRMEEMIHLKIGDIDFEQGKVHLYQSKTLKDRIIPLTELSLRYLKAYIESVRPLIARFSEVKSGSSIIESAVQKDDYVFISRECRPLDPRSINRKVKDFCRKANLSKVFTSHSFRFAYASHLFENKADIRYIYELLGHQSLSMTAKYIIISRKSLVETVKKYHPRERERL